MNGAALWRWGTFKGARHPGILAAWIALVFWIPLVDALRPLPGPEGAASLVSWCVPVGVGATLLALAALSTEEPFLRRLDPATRLVGEAGLLALAPGLMQLPMVGGALIFGPWTLDSLRLTPDILCLDLRLASLALVTLALPLPTPTRSGLFVLAVWPLAGLAGLTGSRLAVVLDPAFALRSPAWAGTVASLLVAAAGVLAAVTLRHARGGAA
jgi:hypothetical protein